MTDLRWTPAQVSELLELWDSPERLTLKRIAHRLGRSIAGVRNKARKLKLPSRPRGRRPGMGHDSDLWVRKTTSAMMATIKKEWTR